EEEIKKEKLLINSLFPTLLLKYNNIKELTNVEVFEGWEGMKTVFLDMAREIPEQGENYIFGASMGKQPKKADMFFEQHRKRMEKKHYHLKIIFNEEMRNYLPRIKPYLENPMHKVKFLHHETFIEFNFYKDTVLFTILQEMPLIIRLRNNEIVDAFKKFFNTMWEQAKE
ncbi:MAG: hypothetical protein KKF89_03340, partial [Nanoarchaeota archaeon]|nr:hypothetical protein [Nanoarchaeota archaeon]MBU1854730.1 hypothetical protein [Nanoarchaeota archaeon]